MSERQDASGDTSQATTRGASAPMCDPTTPEYSTRPVAFRRPDVLAGLLLILAGVAAAVSLLLRWVKNADATGWTLVRDGLQNIPDAVNSGLWQPVAIVLAGAVLLVIGLLLLLPARSHRFLGLLALLLLGEDLRNGPVLLRRVLPPLRLGGMSVDLAFTVVFLAVVVLRALLLGL